MDFDLDVSTLLYVVGTILGVVTVIYFGKEIIADLSPTTKSVALLTAFPTFLALGNLIRRGVLDRFFYILSVFSYLVFLWYIFDTFNPGSNVVFLVLVLSSVMFIGIGYLWGRGVKVEEKWRKGMLVGLLILMVGLVSFDVAGPQPSYELNPQERVNFKGAWKSEQAMEEPITVGKLVVKNDFLFSRYADPPELNAYLYTPEKHDDVHLHYPRWEVEIIAGNSTEQIEVSLRPPISHGVEVEVRRPTYMENIETLPIEIAPTCPDKVEEPKLVITTGGKVGSFETLEKLQR